MDNEVGRLSQDRRNNNVFPDGVEFSYEEDHLESLGSLPSTEGCFLEDNILELTTLQQENYVDPSLGYEFVNSSESGWSSNLDNSDALLAQLTALGVRVPKDYLTLDLDASVSRTASRTASVSTAASENNSWHEEEEEPTTHIEEYESEVVQAEILPNGAGVKVSYDNLQKNYKARISSPKKFHDFLCLVHAQHDEEKVDREQQEGGVSASEMASRKVGAFRSKLALSLAQLKNNRSLNNLQEKCSARIRKLIAEEISYDAMTPDSGIHESFTALSPEEQEKQREEWRSDLAKTEDEIQTLRQVLASKVKHAQDLKRRLGITVWREFSEDFSSSIRSVKESPTYQKTAGAMSAVSEKTGAIFGGIGAKFGQLKETPTFKSFEERVGSVYTTAKSKVTGSESNSTQDFEEALREAEAEKAAAESANGTVAPTTDPGMMVADPSQQQTGMS